MSKVSSNLNRHHLLIDACLKRDVYFFWRGAGLLLISDKGVQNVLREVIAQGHQILGYEGFELDGSAIHPCLDLIYSAERRPDISDPCEIVATWPEDIWIDVVLAPV